jgi:hypothetical protein
VHCRLKVFSCEQRPRTLKLHRLVDLWLWRFHGRGGCTLLRVHFRQPRLRDNNVDLLHREEPLQTRSVQAVVQKGSRVGRLLLLALRRELHRRLVAFLDLLGKVRVYLSVDL